MFDGKLYPLIGITLLCATFSTWADRGRDTDVRFAGREHYSYSDRSHHYPRDGSRYRVEHHRYYHDHAHHGRNHYQRPYSGYGRGYGYGRGHHHHHTHYPDRVVVYRERSDDFYKWVGGAILAGEIIHHTGD